MGNLQVNFNNTKYDLSERFVRKLTDTGNDSVINKSELAGLQKGATESEKKFIEAVLTDDTTVTIPTIDSSTWDPSKVSFDQTAFVEHDNNQTGAFMKKVARLGADKTLDKSDLAELRQGANADERAAVADFEKYGKTGTFAMDAAGEVTGINFNVIPNRDVSSKFLKQLHTLGSDGTLTKGDIDTLNKMGTDEEKAFLASITQNDTFDGLQSINEADEAELMGDVKMYYNDDMAVEGTTNEELVANIGQGDRLNETQTDNSRCGAACMVNAAILNGGKEGFAKLATSLGLEDATELTYGNVHRVQDALYTQAGGTPSQSDEVSSGLKTSYTPGDAQATGTLVTAAELAGNEHKLISGETAVKDFFKDNPQGTLVVNVNRTDENVNYNPSEGNHWVAVKYDEASNTFYAADSYATSGTGENYNALSPAQVTAMLNGSNHHVGIYPKPEADE